MKQKTCKGTLKGLSYAKGNGKLRYAYCQPDLTGHQSFPGAFRVTEVPLLQGMLCDDKTFSKVYIAAALTGTLYLNKIALLL